MGCKIIELLESKQIEIEDLAGKKLAVDSHNLLYQFITTIRQRDGSPLTDSQGRITSHLQGLFARTTKLMKANLKLAFVFDGKPPELKEAEIEKRRKIKIEAQKLFQKAVESKNVEEMQKYGGRFSYLTKEMIEESKELINALGNPVIQAPSEGEAQASYMVKQDDCYAVVSQDADSLLFGAKRAIRNLSIEGRRKVPRTLTYIKVNPEIIDLEENLKKLNLTQDELIILGILSGTDFNPGGIKGIGPKKGLKLIQENKNDFEKIFDSVDWTFPYSWKTVFDTFKKMPIEKDYDLKWKDVDHNKVIEILCEEHNFDRQRIENSLQDLTKKPKSQKGLGEWF